jgi:hypothetical protein
MRIVFPVRQCGKSFARDQLIENAAMALIYDAGGEMPFAALWQAMPVTRRELQRALDRQITLGNIKRRRDGEPVTLTSSARAAIAAGREPLELAA